MVLGEIFFSVRRAKNPCALLDEICIDDISAAVGVCVSIVRCGILDPWPRSPGFGP
jgi:hypothetical protein